MNGDKDLYAVKLFEPTQNRENTVYVLGSDNIFAPDRRQGEANIEVGRQLKFDREQNGWRTSS
ncbi:MULTISPECIES: hypothetical protein [Streptomyces]|uniref:hypothetical protein n=1 Tax=Streptomyces TaxID=1883 RepID=UPI0033A23A8A